MPTNTVVLVGFEDQPNLGIGYLAAVLKEHNFAVEVFDFRQGNQALVERVQQIDPLLIGFSLIFQYHTPLFAKSVRFLRANGITCLICAGGHYPSLRPQEVLKAMPGLDCVVRFEGEDTLLEMATNLAAGRAWHDIQSIAYLQDDQLVTTPLRPLIADLDALPFPLRRSFSYYHCLGIPTTTLLASRGCPRGCTFCSIRRFYSIPPGRLRRTRSPANVVQEMTELYNDYGVRIFLFQDDDFFLIGKRGQAWAEEFLDCLQQSALNNSILWKISCRADEIEPQTFTTLKQAGLYLVYLGLESGNDAGLQTLNKKITVAQNHKAVETLKAVGLNYSFGFMLFDPSSTMERVLENVRFLRTICRDGSAPAPFCKMLPYAGTDIEEQLRAEQRLHGDPYHPDYDFTDGRLDTWYAYLLDVFHPWVFARNGLWGRLHWARFEIDVIKRFYPEVEGIPEHAARIRFLTHWYNEIFCRIVEDSAPFFASRRAQNRRALRQILLQASRQRQWLEERLLAQRETFLSAAGFPAQLVAGMTAQPAQMVVPQDTAMSAIKNAEAIRGTN